MVIGVKGKFCWRGRVVKVVGGVIGLVGCGG